MSRTQALKMFKNAEIAARRCKQAENAMSVNVIKMILERVKLAKNKEFRLGA